jgi:hypothetical protein
LLLVALFFAAKKAAEVMIEEEYDSWAPKLARGLVRVAGFVCRQHRARWWSDVLFVQQVEKRTAVIEATSCFLNAWWLGPVGLLRGIRSRVGQLDKRLALQALVINGLAGVATMGAGLLTSARGDIVRLWPLSLVLGLSITVPIYGVMFRFQQSVGK